MENENKKSRLHPLVAAAAASVVLVSLVGVAAITGVLPTSHGSVPAAGNVATVSMPAAPEISVAKPATVSKLTEDKLAQEEAPKPVHKAAKPVYKPVPQVASSSQSQYSQSGANYAPPIQSSSPNYNYAPAPVAQAPICHNCGRVESIQAIQTAAKPSGLGVVAGGVLGGILGNQVGNGNGRTLATVAGAVGGGFAGNEVEKRTHTATNYRVHVRMEDGSVRTFPQSGADGWRVGDRVRVVNGALSSEG
ncbi:MAG: glycine zipper protein [Herminiimonas sp.]|nr:glycine zipper protein [Herminiimonas sp.]